MKAEQTEEANHAGRPPERSVWGSIKRGWLGRCPQCGEGRLFQKYVSMHDACGSCGLRFDGHQADDAPPYFTMFIIATLVLPLVVLLDAIFGLSLAAVLALGTGLTIVSGFLLLPRIKGAFVAVQWAKHMHGFGDDTGIDSTATS